MSIQNEITPDPVLADLAGRMRDEHFGYQKAVKRLEREHRKAERALEDELCRVVGLKAGDRVMYEGERWTVDSVDMPFLASDEKDWTNVYVTLYKPRNKYHVRRLRFGRDKEIVKL